MPEIQVPSKEKVCCNCVHYRAYKPQKEPDAIWILPSWMGTCRRHKVDRKATRRKCGDFTQIER